MGTERGLSLIFALVMSSCHAACPEAASSGVSSQSPTSGKAKPVNVVTGDAFTCVRWSDGKASCCGNGWQGELGNGAAEDEGKLVAVRDLGDAAELSAGSFHACARRSNGALACWGEGRWGQLGSLSPEERSLVPVAVPGVESATQLSLGILHSCARTSDGHAVCWGRNQVGQLGTGAVSEISPAARVAGLEGVVEVAVGSFHSCALRDDGSVVCWGQNASGELGDGTTDARARPTPVAGLAGVAHLALGGSHSCAQLLDGTVRCWGSNSAGQLGENVGASRTPVVVPGVSSVVELRAHGDRTCARHADGTVDCWGANLARVPRRAGDPGRPSRQMLATPPDVTQIAVGDGHVCALTRAGVLWCAGEGAHGQLCDGSSPPRSNTFPPPP